MNGTEAAQSSSSALSVGRTNARYWRSAEIIGSICDVGSTKQAERAAARAQDPIVIQSVQVCT